VTYSVIYSEGAKQALKTLDRPIQERIIRKINQLEREDFSSRHLGFGLPFFVEEVGGYRATFEKDDKTKTKTIAFIGDHKQYQKWIREQ